MLKYFQSLNLIFHFRGFDKNIKKQNQKQKSQKKMKWKNCKKKSNKKAAGKMIDFIKK